MGTNNLSTIGTSSPTLATGDQLDQYFNAVVQNFVPRNASGVVTSSGGDLGSSSYKWKDLYLAGNGYVDGNLGVGTNSPNGLLHAFASDTGIAPNASARIIAEANAACVYQVLKPNGTVGGLWLSGNSTNGDGRIAYDGPGDDSRAMMFYTASSERMRIDSSGNLGIGTTTPLNTFLDLSANRGLHIDNNSGTSRLVIEGSVASFIDIFDSGATADRKWLNIGSFDDKTKFRLLNDSEVETQTFLTFDHSNGYVGVGSAPSYLLDAITSNSGGTNTAAIRNTSNTANSRASMLIQVAGPSAYDPLLNWSVSGVTNWYAGIDNSSADDWALSVSDNLSSPAISATTGGTVTIPTLNSTTAGLTTANITTANITTADFGTNTITDGNLNGNWSFNSGNLSSVGTISSGAITCTTLNTGQGAYELYAMNQDVETTDDVTFNSATLTNQPRVSVYENIDGTYGSGGNMIWTAKNYDTDSMWASSPNPERITINEDGLYSFTLSLYLTYTSTSTDLDVRVELFNSSLAQQREWVTTIRNSSDTTSYITISGQYYCSSTFFFRADVTGTGYTVKEGSHFEVCKLH